jgi:hypothetical protein
MNIFRKHEKNYDINEIKDKESQKPHDESLPENSIFVKMGVQEQEENSNYPNPELFRRLIEGTSYDRRKGIELKQEKRKEINLQKEIPNIQSRQVPEFPNYSENKQGISTLNENISLKRKKFINKERESRLRHIVYNVLGNKTIKN